MTVEMPPGMEEGEQQQGEAHRLQTVDDLLWALLVGEAKMRVDPASGEAMVDGVAEPAQDHP